MMLEVLTEQSVSRNGDSSWEAESDLKQRLEVLSKVASLLAHEVRNPLASIRLFLGLLRQELGENLTTESWIAHIEKSVDNLEGIVRGMMSFAPQKASSASLVNVASLVHEQIEGFRLRFPEMEVQITVEGNPFLEGFEHPLRQALDNLLNNAAQATEEKGKISILLTGSQASLDLFVRDNGSGIDPKHLSSIFDPFFTTKQSGTGIGLAVVQQAALLHGGRVTVQSQDGTEFHLSLSRSISQVS